MTPTHARTNHVMPRQTMLDFWEGDWSFWAAGATAEALGLHAPPSDGSSGGGGLAGQTRDSLATGAAGGGVLNVVVYRGSTAARTLLHEQELWLSPSSLDRKGSLGRGREDFSSKVRRRRWVGLLQASCTVLPSSRSYFHWIGSGLGAGER
jgi:hypothetical protein